MLARVRSAAVLGIEAYVVEVETDVVKGLPSFATVGLPQGAVKEGRERVSAAITNSGFEFPLRRITVNLAPADVRKAGSAFDLPIAIGLLAATGQIIPEGDATGLPSLRDYLIVGELGLEGDVRPVHGALCIAAGVQQAGVTGLLVPTANLDEASIVHGIDVHGVDSLAQAVAFFSRHGPLRTPSKARPPSLAMYSLSFAEVRGQEQAKRALEVAAAGAHNLLMMGPPGSGKTMLARRLPSILPPLTRPEALETTKVHSVAGFLAAGDGLVTTRPFRAPHHTISDAGLIGGGANPRPGEVSVAHGGVLFLDELPEFRKSVLEVLRQPLEDGRVTISRASKTVCYPSRFMLAAAMNPCPCGYYGDPGHTCSCGVMSIDRYLARISGPLLDRIDIHIEVPAVPYRELSCEASGDSSETVRERVERARARQLDRFSSSPGVFANAHMGPLDLRRFCRVSASADAVLKSAIARLHLSARAYHRVLKIARTVADLAEADEIRSVDVSEAIQYRTLDRK